MSAKRATMVVAVTTAVLLATTLLEGCGQKGALYLPAQKKTRVPASAPSTPATSQPASQP